MFVRETKTKDKLTGTVYRKHTLVESFRSKKGPRQRTIMQLGTLDLPEKLWPALAAELERRLAGQSGTEQSSFLKADKNVRKLADEAMEHYLFRQERKTERARRLEHRQLVGVDLNTATTSHSRSLGPELVGHQAWGNLRFPEILEGCGLSPRERSLAEAVVLGRLIEPGSDLATWNWIRNLSAATELVETSIEKVKKNSVCEIADQLLKHKEAAVIYVANSCRSGISESQNRPRHAPHFSPTGSANRGTSIYFHIGLSFAHFHRTPSLRNRRLPSLGDHPRYLENASAQPDYRNG